MHQRVPYHVPSGDRRSGRRYPIDAEVDYVLLKGKVIQAAGHGRTINISSSGIFFNSGHPIRPGTPIELSIAWPARLGGAIRLQLWVNGRSMRTDGNCNGVEIIRHEFRTAALHQPFVRFGLAAMTSNLCT